MEKQKQYEIIGFSKYTISSDCVITRKDNRRIIRAGKSSYKGTKRFALIPDGDEKKMFYVSEPRLLYCAVKGINPMNIGKSYRFFFADENKEKTMENIIIREPWECIRLIADKAKEWSISKETYYNQSIFFAQVVLSDDAEKIYAEVNKYEHQIKQKISRFIVNEERINNVYLKLVNDFVIGVKDGNLRPLHPLPYIKRQINVLIRMGRIKDTDREKIPAHIKLYRGDRISGKYIDTFQKSIEYDDSHESINL
jgi:hypothetical protein